MDDSMQETADQVIAPEVVDEAEPVADGEVLHITAPTPEALGIDLPDDPIEAQAVLLSELATTRAAANEVFEQMQRIAAEYENFRRRVDRDQRDLVARSSQRVIEQLMPTLDNFDAALAYTPQTEAETNLLEGMRGTHSQLLDTLGREGFSPIPTTGEKFDPAVHEAVSGPGEGDGELVVDAELRRGYTLNGRVLRPALVSVKYAGGGGDHDDA